MVNELDSLILDLLIITFGVVAILNGQRLYWLFVGIGGAVLGLLLTGWLIPQQPDWIHIVIMLTIGILSGWFARFNEKIAIRAAAFVLGGFILQFLLSDSGLISTGTTGAVFAVAVGGVIGIAVELIYGTNAMIVISSLCGAALVTMPLQAGSAFQAAIFSGLAAVGMLLQSREWTEKKSAEVSNGASGTLESDEVVAQ